MQDNAYERDETTELIWGYLENEISDAQAERLSAVLAERADAREQLVESAVLHGMLFEHFRGAHVSRAQKKGRSSAA